MSDASDFLTK
jgi:hypothetical protein